MPTRPAPRDARDSSRSWRVLVTAGIVAACGAQYLWGSTIGLFLRPLEQELGWTRADIGFVTALTAAASFVLVPAMGWLIDRVPLRPVVIVGAVGQSACIAAGALLAGSVLWFYAQVFGIMIFGVCASLLVLSKIVRAWFDRSLGKAMGALFALAALGSVVNPLVAQASIDRLGWRGAYLALGCLAFAITMPLVLFVLRERRSVDDLASVPLATNAAAATIEPASSRELVRHRAWWVLVAYNAFFGYATTGVAFHLAPLLQDRGATPQQSAMALSISAVGALLGNLAAGALIDRFSVRVVASLVMLVPACGVLILASDQGVAWSLAAAIALGLSMGSEHSLVAVLSGRYFGAAIYGRAYSTQLVAASIGSGLAPWAVGVLQQRTGTYGLALAIGAAAFATSAALAWLLPRVGPAATVGRDGAAAIVA